MTAFPAFQQQPFPPPGSPGFFPAVLQGAEQAGVQRFNQQLDAEEQAAQQQRAMVLAQITQMMQPGVAQPPIPGGTISPQGVPIPMAGQATGGNILPGPSQGQRVGGGGASEVWGPMPLPGADRVAGLDQMIALLASGQEAAPQPQPTPYPALADQEVVQSMIDDSSLGRFAPAFQPDPAAGDPIGQYAAAMGAMRDATAQGESAEYPGSYRGLDSGAGPLKEKMADALAGLKKRSHAKHKAMQEAKVSLADRRQMVTARARGESPVELRAELGTASPADIALLAGAGATQFLPETMDAQFRLAEMATQGQSESARYNALASLAAAMQASGQPIPPEIQQALIAELMPGAAELPPIAEEPEPIVPGGFLGQQEKMWEKGVAAGQKIRLEMVNPILNSLLEGFTKQVTGAR